MDATPPITTDPVELVRRLDAGVIRDRLDDLDRERAALIVLLRAAQRTGKTARGRTLPAESKEAAHAC